MHFDLNLKSLTMSGLKYPFSFIAAHSAHFNFSPPLPRNGHQTAARDCNFSPPLRLASLRERLSSPSGVRAEPGRQTFLMHLWPENDAWNRLISLNNPLAELGAKTCILT